MEEACQADKFSGTFDRIQLIDLVQIACYCVMNADIELEESTGNGLVCIRAGQVIDSSFGSKSGEEALREILSRHNGSFLFRPQDKEVQQSIRKPWEQLLIEAIRYRMTSIPGSASNDFSGRIEEINLVDVIQLACLAKIDRLLRVETESTIGAILFREPGIVHAECGELTGENAFMEIMLAEKGRFESSGLQGDEPVTIESPWENLLIEAQRRWDEKQGADSQSDAMSMIQKLQHMKTSEKIRLAMAGNKEARTILARDGNKMVQLAVINNPKISEGEVNLIAASKYTDEEVFRRITLSREWMRLRQVRYTLAMNPKCPVAIAGKMVETLGTFEWKRLSASKSVPAIVAGIAKRMLSKNN